MTQTNKPLNVLFLQVEIMSFTGTSLRSLTVLMQDDGVASSKFESEPENYIVDQLKRWLKCTGFKLSGKRDELVKRVPECITAGNHHTLDPSIDGGKRFAAKGETSSSRL